MDNAHGRMPLENDPRVMALVNALVNASTVVVRASITFRDHNDQLKTFDLNDSVGERLGVIFGMYQYWRILDNSGQLIMNGGYSLETSPIIFEGITETPLRVFVGNDEYIVSGDKFVMYGNTVIGRGDSFGQSLSIINEHVHSKIL